MMLPYLLVSQPQCHGIITGIGINTLLLVSGETKETVCNVIYKGVIECVVYLSAYFLCAIQMIHTRNTF